MWGYNSDRLESTFHKLLLVNMVAARNRALLVMRREGATPHSTRNDAELRTMFYIVNSGVFMVHIVQAIEVRNRIVILHFSITYYM